MNNSEEIHAPPSDCDNSGSIWTTGRLLFDYIRKQKLENGETGYVAFDDHGDRVHAEYDMVNVRAQGEHVAVGKYFYSKVCGTPRRFFLFNFMKSDVISYAFCFRKCRKCDLS